MPKPLPTHHPAPSLGTGYYLFTAVYNAKLDGTKPPTPKRDRYETLAEVRRAQERFRHQYRDAPGAVSTIVPAAQVRAGKR